MSFTTHASIALLALSLGLASACTKKATVPPAEQAPVACTTEAKICPDGSGVGRTGPNCEFAPCPDAAAGAAPSTPSPEAAPAPTP